MFMQSWPIKAKPLGSWFDLINQLLEKLQVELQINSASNLQSPPASQFREDTPVAIG